LTAEGIDNVATTLYDKIESKGAEDAKKILQTAADKARQLKESVLKTTESENAERIRAAERKAADRLRTARTEASQASKRATLENRKAVLDGVFGAAEEAVAGLPDQAYADLVVRFLLRDGLSGNEVIRVAGRDHERFGRLFSSNADGVLDLLAKRLKKPTFRLTLDPRPADIRGGFLVVGRDFDVDRSTRTILADLRDGLEPELAEILFSAGE